MKDILKAKLKRMITVEEEMVNYIGDILKALIIPSGFPLDRTEALQAILEKIQKDSLEHKKILQAMIKDMGNG